MVRLIRCNDRDTCRNDDEINEFMDKNGHLIMVYNEQVYLSHLYNTDDVITKRSTAKITTLNRNSRTIQSYKIQQDYLESEETYIGDGLIPLKK